MERVMRPVLENASSGTLHQNMPVEHNGRIVPDHPHTHLEAIGRGLSGVAPWLELKHVPDSEKDLQKEFRDYALQTLHQMSLPNGPDRCDFAVHHAMVDAAFLCHGLYRASSAITSKMDGATRENLLRCLQQTREAKRPHANNWLLFSAMIELGIDLLGGRPDYMRIDYALQQHDQWYKGDSMYGDGCHYHHDYYNSYVIHPMMMDIAEKYNHGAPGFDSMFERIERRFIRFSALQERMIGPDGCFPPIGRSLTYRGGAFQALAQAALEGRLDPHLQPAQVRCALTAVLQQTLEPDGTFDDNGWLRPGLCGYQPSMGENYISTGSLYLCSTIFLPLGLPAPNPFWSDADCDWSSKYIWSGADARPDHAMRE
jgi:hypothetical protein